MKRRCPGRGEESCGESRNNKLFVIIVFSDGYLGMRSAKGYLRRRFICGEELSAAKGCLRRLGVEAVGHEDGL